MAKCTCGGKPDSIQAKNWGHTHSQSCPLYKEIEGFDYPPGVDDLDAYTARATSTGDWSFRTSGGRTGGPRH